MPRMKTEIPTFRQFAGSTLEQIYGAEPLAQALELTATEFASGVLVNVTEPGGPARFEFRPLPRLAQISPGYGVVSADFDLDGNLDLAIAQNFFGREPETGHWDGGLGQVFLGDGAGNLVPQRADASGFVVPGDATALTSCDLGDDGICDLVVARNGSRVLSFVPARPPAAGRAALAIRLKGAAGNPDAVGARVTVVRRSGARTCAEVHAGSGYASQSVPWLFFGRPEGDDSAAQPAAEAIDRIEVRWPDGGVSGQRVGIGAMTRYSGRVMLLHP